MLEAIREIFRGPKGDPGADGAPGKDVPTRHGHAEYVGPAHLEGLSKIDHAHETGRHDHAHAVPPEHSHPEHAAHTHEHSPREREYAHDHGEDGRMSPIIRVLPERIRIPLDIVVCAPGTGPTDPDMSKAKLAMLAPIAFYARLGIDLRVKYGAMVMENEDLHFVGSGMRAHYYGHAGAPLTGFIGMDSRGVGPALKNYAGQISYTAGPWGAFIVAGANSTGYVGQTIIHELGHYFLTGDNDDHEDSTFMSSTISASEIITDEQRAIVLEVARRMWGY